MTTLGVPNDTPIEHGLITNSIQRAQSKVEKHHFSIRKQILQYDDVMNKQRESIYVIRREVLSGNALTQLMTDTFAKLIKFLIDPIKEDQLKTPDVLSKIESKVKAIFPLGDATLIDPSTTKKDDVQAQLVKTLNQFYQSRINAYPSNIFESLITRPVLLGFGHGDSEIP
jgi:preprotein translocase subunit SecA